MREKLYLYIVKPHGEGLWDITHLSSEELISNFSDERITVRLLYDEDLFNYLMENPRMLIVSKKPLTNIQHKSWNIYEASFYEFNSDVYPHGPYEIMTGEKKIGVSNIPPIITANGLTNEICFKPARKHIYSHNDNYHLTVIGYNTISGTFDNYTGKILIWSRYPAYSKPNDKISLEFINDGKYKAKFTSAYGSSPSPDEYYISLPNLTDIRSIAVQLRSPNIIRLIVYHGNGIFDSGFLTTNLNFEAYYYLTVFAPGDNNTFIKRVGVLGPNRAPFDNGYYPLYIAAGNAQWGDYDPDLFFYAVYPKWVRRIEFESGKKADIIEFTARGLLDYMKEQFYDYTLVDAERFSKHTLNNAYWRVVDIHIPKPAPRIIEGYENLDHNAHFTREEMPLAKVPLSFENEFSAENEFPLLHLDGHTLTARTYKIGTQFQLKFKLYRPDGTVSESPYVRWDNAGQIFDIKAVYRENKGNLDVWVGVYMDRQFWVLKLQGISLQGSFSWAIHGGPTDYGNEKVWICLRGTMPESLIKDVSDVPLGLMCAHYYDVDDSMRTEYKVVKYNTDLEDFEEIVLLDISRGITSIFNSAKGNLFFLSGILSGITRPDPVLYRIHTYWQGNDIVNLIDASLLNYIPRDKKYLITAITDTNDMLRPDYIWMIAGKLVFQFRNHYSEDIPDVGDLTVKLWIVDEELKDIELSGNHLLLYSDSKVYKADINTLIDEHEHNLNATILPAKTYEFQSLSNDFYRFLPYPKFLFSAKEMKVWDKTEKFWVIWESDTLTLTDHYEDIETPKSIMQKLPDIEEKAKRKLYLFPPSLIVGVPEYPTDADTYINDITGNDIVIDPDDVVEVNEFARHRIASFWFRYFILGDLENTFNDESVTIDTEDWYAKELATRLENFIGTTKGIELLIIGIRTDLRRGVKFTFRDREWLVEEVKYYLAQGNTRVKAKEIKAFQTTSDEQGGKQ